MREAAGQLSLVMARYELELHKPALAAKPGAMQILQQLLGQLDAAGDTTVRDEPPSPATASASTTSTGATASTAVPTADGAPSSSEKLSTSSGA